jgi:hypothetical protein
MNGADDMIMVKKEICCKVINRFKQFNWLWNG